MTPEPPEAVDTTRSHRIVDRLAAGARTTQEIREAVYLDIGDVAAKQSRFWLLLVLATGIATAGVLSDSTATVIGAMIIAPLGTPIQGIAVGISFGEIKPLLRSLATLVLAVAVVIGLAAVLAWVLPELKPLADNSQVTGRSAPTLIDLVAASFTGLAGAFAVCRRDIADILPGVAVAISLVPPLAVVGVALVAGDWEGVLGAGLLFATNVIAIIFLGALVFGAVRVRAGRITPGELHRAWWVVASIALAVVAALAVVTYRAVRLSNWQQAAGRVGSEWASAHGEHFLTSRFEGETLVMVIEGTSNGAKDHELLGLLRGQIPDGTPIVVDRIPAVRREIGNVKG